jgi:hypothetical protein
MAVGKSPRFFGQDFLDKFEGQRPVVPKAAYLEGRAEAFEKGSKCISELYPLLMFDQDIGPYRTEAITSFVERTAESKDDRLNSANSEFYGFCSHLRDVFTQLTPSVRRPLVYYESEVGKDGKERNLTMYSVSRNLLDRLDDYQFFLGGWHTGRLLSCAPEEKDVVKAVAKYDALVYEHGWSWEDAARMDPVEVGTLSADMRMCWGAGWKNRTGRFQGFDREDTIKDYAELINVKVQKEMLKKGQVF